MMGVIISSAVLPATLTLMWSKQNKWAAMLSPPLGLACSLIAWLVTAQQESGILNVDSLGANYPMLGKSALSSLFIFYSSYLFRYTKATAYCVTFCRRTASVLV